MDDVIIALATASDRESLLALLEAQLREHDLPTGGLAAAIDGALAVPARGAFLVAREGPRIVGVAYLSFNWTLEHGGRAAWLEEIYVLPERRSGGLGRRLLQRVVEHARASGCLAIDLEVEASHSRAARLYEREGFLR